MSDKSAIAKTMGNLRKAVEDRDFLSFSREQSKIVNFCRRALFHGDREALGRWYPEISSLLTWFYRSGKADWQEAERSMGGLELLLSLMGNFLDTRALEETMAEVRRSEVDREILKVVSRNREGMRSGDVATQLGKSQSSVTNRLPGLEKMGLIVRSRLGKSSVIYLTPKGRSVTGDLQREATTGACGIETLNEALATQVCQNLFGREQSCSEAISFW